MIGNSKYQWEASLPNVKRDAPDVAKEFGALGLKTELVQDASRDAMLAAIEKLKEAANGADLAVFYFAGHGATWDKAAYLVPADADLADPGKVSRLVSLSTLTAALKGARRRIAALDSCRNNPADGWRQVETESSAVITTTLLRMTVANNQPDSLTLFSTAPGHIALDGPSGQNSPFAAVFLRQLDEPSIDLQALPTGLRRDLLIATQGRQVLWDQNTFQQPSVVSGPGRRPAASGNRGGAAAERVDPSTIVELPNAYAYVRENAHLILPAGLIAYRSPAGSRNSTKIGAFKFDVRTTYGTREHAVFAVIAVEEERQAQIIFSARGRGFPSWTFITGQVSGNKIDFQLSNPGPRFVFDWRDANSGAVTQMPESQNGTIASSSFARLDG